MAGFKRRLNKSIQLRLSAALMLTIVVVAIAAAIFSFVTAFEEAHELQDDTLHQLAALIDRQRIAIAPEDARHAINGDDEENRVIVQPLGGGGKPAADAEVGAWLPLPDTLRDGLHTLEADGQRFRVLVRTTSLGQRIAIAQETGVRNEISRDSALRTLLPLLILIPVLLLIVADLVRKMFRPIAELAAEIDRRAEHEMHPVQDVDLPVEIRPFVRAINGLLARVSESMQAQRRFVADAAHELRSPLTAISLQAERLAGADMSDLAHQRLAALRQGIDRGRKLLDQLLSLARAQNSAERPKSSVSVRQAYQRVLQDLLPQAEAKQIDIGVVGDGDATVRANDLDLVTLVRNLVDNAIRYTPSGGKVDLCVEVEQGRAKLTIQDTGPGIAVVERDRIFDPFHRILGSEQIGSGLGLSIVKTIADAIGAEIRLGFADDVNQLGLRATLFVPLASSAQGGCVHPS